MGWEKGFEFLNFPLRLLSHSFKPLSNNNALNSGAAQRNHLRGNPNIQEVWRRQHPDSLV